MQNQLLSKKHATPKPHLINWKIVSWIKKQGESSLGCLSAETCSLRKWLSIFVINNLLPWLLLSGATSELAPMTGTLLVISLAPIPVVERSLSNSLSFSLPSIKPFRIGGLLWWSRPPYSVITGTLRFERFAPNPNIGFCSKSEQPTSWRASFREIEFRYASQEQQRFSGRVSTAFQSFNFLSTFHSIQWKWIYKDNVNQNHPHTHSKPSFLFHNSNSSTATWLSNPCPQPWQTHSERLIIKPRSKKSVQ